MIKIKVDDRILFKGELGEWIKRPPDVFRDAIQPDKSPAPWMKAILIAMADVVGSKQDTHISVSTKLNKGVRRGWSMEVHFP